MTTNHHGYLCKSGEQSLGPFELFLVGWKLILSETIWFLKSRGRIWESKQLKKRLKVENIRLAELVQKKAEENKYSLDLMDPEVELALGQIDLLKEEIIYLENEFRTKRNIFVENRKQKYLK